MPKHRSGRWMIRRGDAAPWFLATADDGALHWTRDTRFAARFAGEADAARFAKAQVAGDILIVQQEP